MDRNKFLLLKSVSYRLYGTFATFLVSYLVTGKVNIAGMIASVEFVAKVFFYFLHEKIWERIEKIVYGGEKMGLKRKVIGSFRYALIFKGKFVKKALPKIKTCFNENFGTEACEDCAFYDLCEYVHHMSH